MSRLRRLLSAVMATAMAFSMMSTVAFAEVDKRPLDLELAKASAKILSTETPVDGGSSLYYFQSWCEPITAVTLGGAISKAKSVLEDSASTAAKINDAAKALAKAIADFDSATFKGKKQGTPTQLALFYAADAADKLLQETRSSTDGTDVPTDEMWIENGLWNSLVDAITVARRVGMENKDYKTLNAALATMERQTKGFCDDRSFGLMADAPPAGGTDNTPSPSENVANSPATADKVEKTLDAVKELGEIDPAKLPAGVKLETTSAGKTVASIPLGLYSGSADLGMDIMNSVGSNSDVALNLTISAGLTGGSANILLPGGFGAINEPGRIGYSFDYKAKSDYDEAMLAAVKTEGATSTTSQIGGTHTLPVKATITVSTKVPEGETVNIYKYNQYTGKYTLIGSAVSKGGKLVFDTAETGNILFTTGKV